MARSEYIIPQSLWSDQEISVNDWTINIHRFKGIFANTISAGKRVAIKPADFVAEPVVSTNLEYSRKGDGSIKSKDNGRVLVEAGKNGLPTYLVVDWKDEDLCEPNSRGQAGARTDKNVATVNALAFDFDGVSAEKEEEILARFDGLCFVAHSTFSDCSPNKARKKQGDEWVYDSSIERCFRVIVALDKPLEQQHYNTQRRSGVWYLMERFFPENDEQTKNSARLWYVPSCRQDREDAYWHIAQDGMALSTDALIDAYLDMDTSVPAPSTPSTPQATQQVQATDDTDSEEEASESEDTRPRRYVTRVVRDDHRIRCHDGQVRTFGEIIENWDSFPKQSNGNYNVCRPDSTTVGSAFIQRSVHPMYRVARYRLTSAPNRTHHDCDITDNRIALSFSQRGFRPKSTVPNVVKMLDAMEIDLWEDARTGYQYLNGDRFEDQHYTITQDLFYNHWRIDVNRATMCTAIDSFCQSNKIDTLKTYLTDLEWDGTERLEELFIKYLKAADTKMNRTYARKWGISCVARAMDWGCKMDTMVILKGHQGLRKSTFFEVMAGTCPLTGNSFFSDEPIETTGVDGLTKLRLAWIHEWAELSGMSRKESGDVKQFITKRTDRYRKKYGRKETIADRHCVIVGTVNDDEIFKDDTGSRRFWAVECHGEEHKQAFNIKDLADARDQLWAEAVALYNAGEQWWLNEEEQKQSSRTNSKFDSVDVHQVLVEEWLANNSDRIFNIAEMIEDIYMETYTTDDGEERKRAKAVKPKSYMNWYSQALKSMGCGMLNDGKKCRHNKKLSRWYIAPSVSDEDEFVTTCDPDNGNNTLQIRLENDPKSERFGMVVAAKRFAQDWVYYEDMSPEVQGDYDARYPKQSHLQVSKPLFDDDEPAFVPFENNRRFRL